MNDLVNFAIAVTVVFSVVAIIAGTWKLLRKLCWNCKRLFAMEATGELRNMHHAYDKYYEWEYEVRCKYCSHSVWKSRDNLPRESSI